MAKMNWGYARQRSKMRSNGVEPVRSAKIGMRITRAPYDVSPEPSENTYPRRKGVGVSWIYIGDEAVDAGIVDGVSDREPDFVVRDVASALELIEKLREMIRGLDKIAAKAA